MPLTLEMPVVDAELPSMLGEENTTAEAAADLLDFGDAEETQAEQEDEPEPPPAAAEEHPTKPKRGRKKKQQESESEPGQDHPLDTNAPTGEAPADATPHSMPSTRQFQIAQVRALYVEVCLEMAECEAEIEDKKDELKRLQKQFASLSIELRLAMRDAEYQPMLPLGNDQPAASAVPLQSPSESDAWRQVSINQLGLSPKLEEKLVDAGAINIGQLEDLRAEISQGRAKWPKGVGPARITEIENAVIDWLSKNRDASTFAELTTVTPGDIPTAQQWEAMSEDQRRDFIARRAEAINDGTDGCLDSKNGETIRHWDQGFADFNTSIEPGNGSVRACELRDCIYLPGPEMDDWIRGWLSAGAEEREPAPSANPAAGAFTSLDDL